MKFKDLISIIFGGLGSILTSLWGEITPQMTTLFILIACDFITGFIVAAIFKESPKTDSGRLSSREMLKGLFRKAGLLVIIIISYQLDKTLNIDYVKYFTCLALILEEIISLIENLGYMNIPIPSIISNAIELLNQKVKEGVKK